MIAQDYVYNGKIINVVDGDTVDILIDLGFYTFVKERMRLAFIDTPEMNSKIEEERKLAQEAKVWLTHFNGADVTLKSHKKDRYGRFIAEIFTKGATVSLNQQLLDNGMAKKYVE